MILLFLLGCAAGDWDVSLWGEDYIETGIPAGEFADDCAVTFDHFVVVVSDVALSDGDGDPVATLPDAQAFDLVLPGPHALGTVRAPAGPYATMTARIGPAAEPSLANTDIAPDGASIRVAGTLTCPSGEVAFDWAFDTDTTYTCAPEGLSVPQGGADGTELTIHGDHLFYDALEDPDALLRGEAFVSADADDDGRVTLAELEDVSVPALGYAVGRHSDATDLRTFLTILTRGVGHVDGEGHCETDG